ncbi:MAG: hypothetical protein AUJ75_03530 [Candidatus Omnitrophica bacterium CG1_02_49_10]|nr:MAG: hypothetical protein AUJ75_03530 [Candidatus Omnitrophica bacterium CG1_02_49_10]
MKDLYKRFLSSEEWLIREEVWNKNLQGVRESQFTLGNGYIGSRGVLEEIPYDAYPGTYIAGLFDSSGAQVPELVNLPNPIDFKISVEGEKLGLVAMDVLKHNRVLDMKKGLLARRTVYSNVRNERFDYQSVRFFSMDDPHVGVMQVCLTPLDNDTNIDVETTFDLSVTNKGILSEGRKNHIKIMEVKNIRDIYYASVQTFASKVYVNYAGILNCCTGDITQNTSERVLHMRAEKGKTICFTKVFHIATSRDVKPRNMKPHALKAVRKAAEAGFENLLKKHVSAWEKRWIGADVILKPDKELEKALRFNIYHLLIAGKDNGSTSIGARTLSGEGYRGHIFWDTEIFILPFFIYTNPDAAKGMLSYRYDRMGEARRNARKRGYKGAMFPWESADLGNETTPPWHRDLDGRIIKIHTMDTEQHINCDIAYAVYHYGLATGDKEFMMKKGYELFFEIARFWASRVLFDKSKKRYEIQRVMGPDEFHPIVDNNSYTNGMVAWNLRKAFELFEENKRCGEKWSRDLSERIRLSDREAKRWKSIAAGLFIPYSKRKDVIEAFDGFLRRKYIRIKELDNNFMPVLPKEATFKDIDTTQFVKQSDTVMLLYLLDGDFSHEEKRRNFAFYDARTLHKSSLSAAISSIMALRTGDIIKASRYLSYAAYMDINNLSGNTADGMHAASCGGTWQAFINGIGGMSVKDGILRFNPLFPKEIKCLKFHIRFKSYRISAEIFRNRIAITPSLKRAKRGVLRLEAFGRLCEAPVGKKTVFRG